VSNRRLAWATVLRMGEASATRRADLPLLPAGPARERADAARNRAKALAAAERLFAARGVAAVSMDDIAAAAGVGKGTLYRRFGDKSGLAAALLGERESRLQAAMLGGPPPLGPGAPPADRLAAFAAAYLEFVDAHLDLVAMSQTASPGARLRTGSHRLWRQHCRILLTEAGTADPGPRADVLLAALTAEQVRHWRHGEGRSLAGLTGTITEIARRLAVP
jgi:AcrR family transcriptional regulator